MCDKATPIVVLTGHHAIYKTTFTNSSLPSSSQLQSLYANRDQTILTSPGWLEFTIYDVVEAANTSDVQLCHAGRWISYSSQKCFEEDPDTPTVQKKHYFGGNGYDFHMASEHIRYWAPVRDNHDGSYSVSMYVQDGGNYSIQLNVNNHRGCHFADCDVPSDKCSTYMDLKYRMSCSQSNKCVTDIQTRNVHVAPAPTSSASVPTLPMCSSHNLGQQSGRWMSAEALRALNVTPFGIPGVPLYWQPFDCQISAWLTPNEVKSCIENKTLAFVGFSRERTHFFDTLDFQLKPVKYEKLLGATVVENLYYFTLYFGELKDRKTWNTNGQLMHTLSTFKKELQENYLCLSDDQFNQTMSRQDLSATVLARVKKLRHQKTAILITEESLFMSETGKRSMWKNTVKDFLTEISSVCSQSNVKIVYKTATSLRAQFGSLSWQRMYEQSRISAKIALSLNMTVLDGFAVTHPRIMDHSVFRDGLHNFEYNVMWKGNYVSKTLSMMFLKEVC